VHGICDGRMAASRYFKALREAAISLDSLRVLYGDATTRGILRQWKTELATERSRISSTLKDHSGRRLMRDFIHKSSIKGRGRTLKRIDARFGAGAALTSTPLRARGRLPCGGPWRRAHRSSPRLHPTAVWPRTS
jgi:hypothetical protein